ncbi:MAG TPA: outer membrane protein [Pseudolabrys sp.]|nr:outer membrane protein [Pseudolabrys sp.]
MKRVVLASLAAFAMCATCATTATTATAADLGRALPTKAPEYVPPMYSWTGFYLGINGGGGWGTSSFSAPFTTGSFDTSGGVVGGTIGYNWQTGPVVFGLEGDIDWSGIRGDTICAPLTSCETRNDWLGTFRGRLGYAANMFMPYITGGLAVGNIKTNIPGFGSSDETNAGWTIGAGLETKIAGPWSAKIEYLFVDLGRGDSVLGSDAKFRTNLVRAGVNYRFW